MRARTITIVIGVATAAVMALGAQPATALPHYHTRVTITGAFPGINRCCSYLGKVYSEVHKCEKGRKVVLFDQRPGADTRRGKDRSHFGGGDHQSAQWSIVGPRWEGRRVYAKVMPQRNDGYVCRADRSPILDGELGVSYG